MARANINSLPFADAATIVRANQKDNYFSSTLNQQISDVLKIFKGQRFVNSNPGEIAIVGKATYFMLTTVFGARTLGEEYVDIIYVTRLGKRMPRLASRLLFTVSYIIGPYIVARVARMMRPESEAATSWYVKLFTSYPSLFDTMMNVHVALFYFQGSFYSISKRIFGMRYVFGHNKDEKQLASTGNYSVLGGIILVQLMLKMLIKLNQILGLKKSTIAEGASSMSNISRISRLEQLESLNKHINGARGLTRRVTVDLSDPKQLPYIPENSRSCMLCLSSMINPSAANCGHFFCWDCVVDWIREHPECPLCRQTCLEQNLLPLR